MAIRDWVKRKTVFPKFPRIPGQENVLLSNGDYINIRDVSWTGMTTIRELPPEVQTQAIEAVVAIFRRRLYEHVYRG